MQRSRSQIQRVITTFVSHDDREANERSEWRAMTPLQRLQAVETMRQLNHPKYDPAADRLQRFYTVA
ncbi:MAG: hypothetical protein KDK97_21895 [Verrucomicrobiales bacterium]|nr:hypothetical protein [Verrucomicrobiales bacterium]